MTVQKIKMLETFRGKEFEEIKGFTYGETYDINDASLVEVILNAKLGVVVKGTPKAGKPEEVKPGAETTDPIVPTVGEALETIKAEIAEIEAKKDADGKLHHKTQEKLDKLLEEKAALEANPSSTLLD